MSAGRGTGAAAPPGGRAPGERFEWIEPLEAERPGAAAGARAGATPRAEPARRCPSCGWLDAAREVECFRCGAPLPSLEASAPPDAPTLPPARAPGRAPDVHLTPAAEVLGGAGVNDDPAVWALRRRSAALGLEPGFDHLLVLGHVNHEVFQRFAHQQAVARRALRELGGTALLADETGLGKTIEAGLIAKELLLRGLVRSVLVVVPASLALQWREEMRAKFRLDFVVARAPADLVGDPPLVLVSYAGLRGKRVGDRLRERPVDLLICDEAHHLRNRGTKQYRAVGRLRKKYALLLSATPFHNRLQELKALLDVLKPGLLGSTRAFTKQYVDPKDPRRPRNVHHLRALLAEVMIRNRRAEVAVRLPPRRAATYHVELFEEERAFYEDLTALVQGEVKLRVRDPLEAGRHMPLVLALINLQRELCSSPRAVAKALDRLGASDLLPLDVGDRLRAMAARARALPRWRKGAAVDDVLARFEGKLLVFCEFRATIDALLARLEAAGVPAVAFHGGLDPEERQRAIETFRGPARVLVASRAGAEGLNVQFCANVLNFDLPWNPMIVEQRIGRVHRLGQTQPVTVLNLSVAGTIEARILDLLTTKLHLFTSVLGEVDLILGALHAERGFEDLLREAWLQGAVDGDMERALDGFGRELDRARVGYREIKEAEAVLDEVAPPTLEAPAEGQGAEQPSGAAADGAGAGAGAS